MLKIEANNKNITISEQNNCIAVICTSYNSHTDKNHRVSYTMTKEEFVTFFGLISGIVEYERGD